MLLVCDLSNYNMVLISPNSQVDATDDATDDATNDNVANDGAGVADDTAGMCYYSLYHVPNHLCVASSFFFPSKSYFRSLLILEQMSPTTLPTSLMILRTLQTMPLVRDFSSWNLLIKSNLTIDVIDEDTAKADAKAAKATAKAEKAATKAAAKAAKEAAATADDEDN